jgi:hypothetical protein
MNTRSKTIAKAIAEPSTKVYAKTIAEPFTKVYAKTITELEVNIDFDDASKEWHKNKKSIGNSQYKYICQIQTNKNKRGICNKICHQGSDKCWIHRNK